MPRNPTWRRAAATLLLAPALALGAAETPRRSALDAQLFYQLLIAEMQLRAGDAGSAYRALLDAARRSGQPQLFRRAMDVALQSRAGDEALAAVRAWREAEPRAADPLRLELQILAALGRLGESAEPLQALLALTPEAERAGVITALPRLFERAADKREAAALLAQALAPQLESAATRTAARVALGRAWLAADDADRALALARESARDDPDAPAPVLLALELMRSRPAAEAIVVDHLAHPGREAVLRLAYVRALTVAQRIGDAIAQLEAMTRERPGDAQPYLTLGALQLELREFGAAESALRRYVELAQRPAVGAPAAAAEGAAATVVPAPPAAAASAAPTQGTAPGQAAADPAAEAASEPPDEDAAAPGPAAQAESSPPQAAAQQGLTQAWLMLAQIAEQRGDAAAAEQWLSRIDDPQRAVEVQSRRALLMARQGRLDEALASLRALPEREAGDARAKLVAEAQLLRELRQWQAAFDAYGRALESAPDDAELLYEQAMVAEKMDRIELLEARLRRLIELQPDHAHAHNALGYSLADRGQRLPEARQLIERALQLRPGDPFITDSLGWVEFRAGNLAEARRLLEQAWAARPDTEIGAHLGEVLWAIGQRDEARRVWRQAMARDTDNEVLRETLKRLQVDL